jgi:DNA polymerase I
VEVKVPTQILVEGAPLGESQAVFHCLLATMPFRETWLVDFEFNGTPGDTQNPVCLVAWELRSGRKIRLFRDEFGALPPYPTDASVLFVAYYASAELGCRLSLGWPLPVHVLDLFTEFRCFTNGLSPRYGSGLLGAFFWRRRVMQGEPFSAQERAGVLDYCETDVIAMADLLPHLLPPIVEEGLNYALLRGRYMKACARMEFAGVPLDVELLALLKQYWPDIQGELIAAVDRDPGYGVYEGRTFKRSLFLQLLARRGIPWVALERSDEEIEAGKGEVPDLSDDAFREVTKRHPEFAALKELRADLSAMRLIDLTVGKDNRNRTLVSAFRARTSRNQPSNSKFIFGPSVFLRSLINRPQVTAWPMWTIASKKLVSPPGSPAIR